MAGADCPITQVSARGYTVPTETPEADGTLRWDRTQLTVVEIDAGGRSGLGYSYGAAAMTAVIEDMLAPVLLGKDPFALPALHEGMQAAVRNIGRSGIAATVVSAVDTALWDLKARLLGIPLVDLLGARRDGVDVYGSGGFITDPDRDAIARFCDWTGRLGCRSVKMKISGDAGQDLRRIERFRDALPGVALMIDANGACGRRQALAFAQQAAGLGVVWFEEPVPSDDLRGLRHIREHGPATVEIAAGEYAFDPLDARRMIEAAAVDVMQLDVTRIGGITGFLQAAAIADAHHVPLSAHAAPALHLAVCCSAPRVRHIEWFHDHARIETMLFDGAPVPVDGRLWPDRSACGHGLSFRSRDAERFATPPATG